MVSRFEPINALAELSFRSVWIVFRREESGVAERNDVQEIKIDAAMQPVGATEEPSSGGEQQRADVPAAGGAERRQHQRHAIDAWAEVMVKDATVLFRGRVLDISVGGCFIATQARLRMKPGTPVEMVFRLASQTLRCDASCRVVRPTGAGFLFGEMDAQTRKTIDSLIADLETAQAA